MTKRNNISVPDNYFEQLQSRLQAIPGQERAPRGVRILAPSLALAASLLILVAVGNFVLGKATATGEESPSEWAYVSYLAQSLDPDGVIPEWEEDTDEPLTSDDYEKDY